MFDFHAELNQRLKQNTDSLKMGIEVGLRECEDTKKALRAIILAYDVAMTPQNEFGIKQITVLPTVMLAAIEAARKHL